MSQDQLQQVLNLIDEKNRQDPKTINSNGEELTEELLYSQRMTAWLFKMETSPAAELQIAVRANHVGRWESPRTDYPEGRKGYLKWRTDLIQHHLQLTHQMMDQAGFGEAQKQAVRKIMEKKHIKRDADCQTYEDVICLVFLENYLADFYAAADIEEEKMVSIIQKTWHKMSAKGQEMALTIPFSAEALDLVKKAL
ncbi:DUF4202 domain-containing protein [Persicobacter psychrovividus]|uniref:DUF4202 domain-containing protein n=1 Tax=Persicobacter psychrovividus TaxID=387638 RepID=A0ABM7VJ06_9BACT|nr:hypothetical protein PEPS_32490 [Persicobacter psychrovividus]